jgi:hypothetical protein
VPLIGSHATVTSGSRPAGLSYGSGVGTAPFGELLAALPDVPFVVETPGRRGTRGTSLR